jgi:hypothetical protein
MDWGLVATIGVPTAGALWAGFGWIIKVRFDRRIDDEIEDRDAAVAAAHVKIDHNRANADQKFGAVEHRIEKAVSDIVSLQRAEERHSQAIQHLEVLMKDHHAALDRRLDDLFMLLRDRT